jgi:hypothetical protein
MGQHLLHRLMIEVGTVVAVEHQRRSTLQEWLASNIIRRYDYVHCVVSNKDQSATLYVGTENWPMQVHTQSPSRTRHHLRLGFGSLILRHFKPE